jgi:ABC-2 type transport system ATP-binding protein
MISLGLSPRQLTGMITIPVMDKQVLANLNKELVGAGIDVYQMSTIKSDLESIFIDIVNN